MGMQVTCTTVLICQEMSLIHAKALVKNNNIPDIYNNLQYSVFVPYKTNLTKFIHVYLYIDADEKLSPHLFYNYA